MDKHEALKQLRTGLYTRLAPSSLGGVGVFAILPIPQGYDPFIHCREADEDIYITEDDLKNLHPEIVKYICDFFPFDDALGYILPDYSPLQIDQAFYINHSNHPNMAATHHGEHFYTTRPINPGEELTVNYNSYDSRGLDNSPRKD